MRYRFIYSKWTYWPHEDSNVVHYINEKLIKKTSKIGSSFGYTSTEADNFDTKQIKIYFPRFHS
mgnify:CR=1 FL=1